MVGITILLQADFEANKLTLKQNLLNQIVQAMLKMTTTGHGFDNNASAAEFKPIDYFVKVDGTLLIHNTIGIQDCGENPIYPQGGTWIYDRANWCPGKRAQAFEHDITTQITAGDSIELNIDFPSLFLEWNSNAILYN